MGVLVPLLEALPGYIFTVSGCLSLTINNFSVWWLNIKKNIGSVIDIIFMESRNNTVPGKHRVNGGNIFR